MDNKEEILHIAFNTESVEDILEEVVIGLEESDKKTFIVTPNPELVLLALDSNSYRNVLNKADISLPDGVGIIWASKLLKKPIPSRITGVDFMKSLCEKVSKRPVTIGLFGAEPGVAELTADCLRKLYPDLQISYVSDEWDINTFNSSSVDILFVALGSPKQEQWIHDHLDELSVKVVMGVGGAFDMISGRIKRAPMFLQKLGLEWLWRLYLQPWRIKRQIKLTRFVWLVLKEKYFPSVVAQ